MHSPAATAAAGPPLLPPGTRALSQGLCVGKKAEFSVDDPIANSSKLPLPIRTDPSSNNLLSTDNELPTFLKRFVDSFFILVFQIGLLFLFLDVFLLVL